MKIYIYIYIYTTDKLITILLGNMTCTFCFKHEYNKNKKRFEKKGCWDQLNVEEELVGKMFKKYNWGNRKCQDV